MNGEARKNVTCALLCRAFNRNIHGLPFRLLFMTILPSSLPPADAFIRGGHTFRQGAFRVLPVNPSGSGIH